MASDAAALAGMGVTAGLRLAAISGGWSFL